MNDINLQELGRMMPSLTGTARQNLAPDGESFDSALNNASSALSKHPLPVKKSDSPDDALPRNIIQRPFIGNIPVTTYYDVSRQAPVVEPAFEQPVNNSAQEFLLSQMAHHGNEKRNLCEKGIKIENRPFLRRSFE